MLLIYFSCLALLFIVLLHYFKPIYAIFLFILLFLCFEYHIYIKSIIYKDETIPKYNKEELYDYLKHGDIVITKNIPFEYEILNSLKYFNYRLSHFSLIIEENNEKYIVDASWINYNKYTLDFKICELTNTKWFLSKIPLKEYLDKDNILIRLFRNNKKLKIDIENIDNDIIIPIINKKFFYCTILIGNILSQNNIIKKSNKLFPYRTNDFINLLKDEGFESFILVYDNDNGNGNKPKKYDPVCPLKMYNLIYLILLCLLYKLKSKYIFLIFLCLFIIIQFI